MTDKSMFTRWAVWRVEGQVRWGVRRYRHRVTNVAAASFEDALRLAESALIGDWEEAIDAKVLSIAPLRGKDGSGVVVSVEVADG